jgi:hypothetical protein
MLWIFQRGDEVCRFETRYDSGTSEFVLVIQLPGNAQHVERFEDTAAFQHRLAALETQLQAEQWRATGSPVLLRDGWRI